VSVPANAATGFARAPGAYERTRPSYPDEAVAWLCRQLGIGPGKAVCDLGAGTGKLTRLLVPSGAEVVAVEPLDAMRAELSRALPDIDVRPGRGEELPFEAASLDAIVVAQAFHWFDAPTAVDEAARTLRNGGGLGLIWNAWDLDDPLQARLDAFVKQHAPPDPDEEGIRPVPYTSAAHEAARWRRAFPHPDFEPAGQIDLRWTQRLPASALIDRIRSVSVIGALPDGPREAALVDAARLAGELGEELELVYRTVGYAWRRRAR
jgi:SAM-dependent methyltransferase